MEVLRARGFEDRWIQWVVALLTTTSTEIIVNGVPGRSISHAQGLRQGDPVSPLIFVIALDALTAVVGKAFAEATLSSF